MPRQGRTSALGDQPAMPGPAEIEAAARAAGIDDLISRLPAGYESLLGKWFVDGTELSGGEWQRVALAPPLYGAAADHHPRRADQRHGPMGGG